MSIGRALAHVAAGDPERVALRTGCGTWTRAELDVATNRLARALQAAGVGHDDVVVLSLPNGPDLVLAALATWKAGATPSPVSPGLAADERAALLELVRPALVVDSPVGDAGSYDGGPLPDLVASSWKAVPSSGSTGPPKMVRAAAPATVDPELPVAGFVPHAAVQLVAGPLTGAAPFVYAMRGLMTGHELVVMDSFDPAEWLRLVQQWRVTWSVLSPATMQRIWRSPARGAAEVSSLGSVLHVGARCPRWLKRGWLDWLGPERVVEVYAGTEAQGVTAVSGPEWLRRPGTVGRAVPGCEFQVVRPDGERCRPGEPGEVVMRRDRPTYSYLGAEAEVRDGWHTLGDRGHLDDDGYLFLGDRLGDLVRTHAGPVQPADVEEVLDEHPDVRASVVVGRDGSLHAVVQAEPGTDVDVAALGSWAAERLPSSLRPATWAVSDLALRDDAGKVRRSRYS